jgi:hypothetical protein
MANLLKVRVAKVSAKASKNGNFIHTLKTEGKSIEVMGIKKTSGALTYFLALPGAIKSGEEFEIDMDLFTINAREMADGDGVAVTDDAGKPIVLKWLGIK